jgi:hypothetical protein
MERLRDSAALRDLTPGSHVGWIVSDPDEYVELGAAVLARASETGEKSAVFGPDGSARDALAGSAVLVADPRTAFLGGGPLEPSTMFAVFEAQSVLARSEGYRGLCVVADMDWLLPLHPSTEDLVSFELLLDRHAARLGRDDRVRLSHDLVRYDRAHGRLLRASARGRGPSVASVQVPRGRA